MSDYQKFQYSVFLDDNKLEQIVIRTETFEELLTAKADVNKILDKRAKINVFEQPAQPTNNTHPELKEDLGTCPNCDAPMKLSKAGKPYCSKVCWK